MTPGVRGDTRGQSSPLAPVPRTLTLCRPEPLPGRGAGAPPGPPHPPLPRRYLAAAIKELAITPAEPVPAAGSAALSLKS